MQRTQPLDTESVEAIVFRCSSKQFFLKIAQYSQENTCVEPKGLQLPQILQIFNYSSFYRTLWRAASICSAIMIRGVFRALLKQLFAEPFVNYLSIKVPSYIFGMVLSTPLMTSRKTLLHPMTDFLIQSVCQVLFLRYCFFMNNGGIYGLNTTKTCKCIMRFSN